MRAVYFESAFCCMILFLLALKLAKALFGRHFHLHVVTLFLEPTLLKCYCIWKFMASLMFVVIEYFTVFLCICICTCMLV